MTTASRQLRVGWKLATLSGKMASVRYRALLPVLALRSKGVGHRLFATGLELHLDGLDALVIVKSFTPDDIYLAQRACERGIRVVFDLCDNIFLDSYRAGKAQMRPAHVLEVLAPYLDAIVVTTEPLAQAVRQALPAANVHVVPDGIETLELVQQGDTLLRSAHAAQERGRFSLYRQKVRNTLMRVREEGPASIPPLARYVYGKGMGVMRRKASALRARLLRSSALPAKSRAAPQPSTVPIARKQAKRQILWFGNHGAPHARFGMLDLLDWREPLESAAREFEDVELVVVSNSREKYEAHIRPLGIASRYVEWSPAAVENCLRSANVAVIPNSLDPFSLCKSANRTVLAVSAGVPVVATLTPALQPLLPHVHVGDPLSGLRKYLADPELGRRDAAAAAVVAEAEFGQAALGRRWLDLLGLMREHQSAAAGRDAQCAVVLHLIQDLDLALPILQALAREGTTSEAWCSAGLARKSPRVLPALRENGVAIKVFPDDVSPGRMIFPPGLKVLLTVAETNLSPHRFTRVITEAAIARGLRVATLQHGYENVGLTYSDDVHTIEKINIAAHHIYLWGDKSTLHPRASASVRARTMPVGCPKPVECPPAALDGKLDHTRPIVGVFENLHWHRYSDAYRQAFIEAVRAVAEQFPQVCFLVKPHHAGMWLTGRYKGDRPQAENLVIADPASAEWENSTAPALLGHLAAVITTPSTVALDAARRGMPCAVFAHELDIPQYAPLPLLTSYADWARFVRAALDDGSDALKAASRAFVDRVLVPGDAAGRIARDLANMAQR